MRLHFFFTSHCRSIFFTSLTILTLLSGCAPVPTPPSHKTNRRPITQNINNAILNQISVEDLRVTADLMARDLVLQPCLAQRPTPPVIAVKPIENKTDLNIDPDIFQKTIRVKLMEKAGGHILFRDEVSHNYTVEERLKQSGKVKMKTTTTSTRYRRPTRVGSPIIATEEQESKSVRVDEGEAVKRVADANYFLTGLIYSTTEVASGESEQGMRYFQFQFRLTDTQTNIIMWEKEYTVKRQAFFR